MANITISMPRIIATMVLDACRSCREGLTLGEVAKFNLLISFENALANGIAFRRPVDVTGYMEPCSECGGVVCACGFCGTFAADCDAERRCCQDCEHQPRPAAVASGA